MINKLFDLTAAATADDTIVIQEVELQNRDIAIIGISCEIAEAENWKQFWDTLIHGKDLVGDLPSGRDEDIQSLFFQQGMDGTRQKYCKGAFIREIDKFDHAFFRISPKEAELMDPRQRLFLETAWKSLEDAGYGGDKLKGSRTGVFVGSSSGMQEEYKRFIELGAPSQYNAAGVGNIKSVIASRISYLLDFRGPSMVVDTACSSSLVAVHIACQSLRNDECEYAVAGGVNIALLPIQSERKDDLGITSKDGLTRTFDNSSDGTGIGEGVAAILLKPAVKAVEDGDYIYAVIKGSAINQDGNSNGITAPNAAAQEDVILRALKDARIHPETLSFIEAHGTGTRLGDPIEIDGIIKAFSKYTARKQFCAIGSVKSNVGHLDSAAGIVGLIKAALSINHRILPPSIHFETPNRNIKFQESPVFVNTGLLPLDEDSPIRCGVSSFGLSGTNSHIILESYKNRMSADANTAMEVLALSAKNVNSLKQLIRSFANYINENQKIPIEDICYTINTGRGHYNNRLALIVTDLKDLSARLELLNSLDDLWLCNHMGMFYQTSVDSQAEKGKHNRTTVTDGELRDFHNTNLSRNEKENILKSLCNDYVAGADIDWENLYRQNRYRVAGLPVYPFARERSWIMLEESIRTRRDQHSKETDSASIAVDVRLLGRDSGLYSEMERLVASAWAKVLGYREIDINRDLYTAGGDSIHATRIANFLEEPIGRKIEISDVLRYPTVAEFSMIIEKSDTGADVETAIKPADKRDVYPLSAAQKRLLMLHKLDEESLAYNLPVSLSVEGNLNIDQLNRAIGKIIERHEVFRTTFELQEGEWVQRVHEDSNFGLQRTVDTGQGIEKLINDFIKPFNLEKGPLFRAMVIEREENKHIFVMDCHHIVSDGTTMGILAREIVAVYSGGAQVNKPELQYKDYAVWHNRRLESEVLSKQRKYWLDVFGGRDIPELLMPLDKNRPEIQTYKGSRVYCRLNQDLAEGLKQLSVETGSTLYMVMLAAYNVLLYKYTNQQDIIVGSAVTGRPNVKLESMMGVFINSLPMRNYPSGDKNFIDFLFEVKENVMEAYNNQECQFEDLVDRLALKRDLSRSPLFDTMFIMQNMKNQPIDIPDLKISEFVMEHKFSKYDLTLEAMEEAGFISMSFEYATDLFSRDFIEKLAGHYIHIIQRIVASSSIRIADIDMLGANEKEMLLNHSTGHMNKHTSGLTLNAGFEQQVGLHTDQIALVSEEGSLTYQELNHYANRIAGLLRSEQIAPNDPVLVLMDKSVHAIASILGILKAGGAYVPLDPAYPLQRLAYMTEHSGSRFIITEQEHLEEALVLSMNEKKLTILNVTGTGSESGSHTGRIYSRTDIAAQSSDNCPPSNQYADLMYIMYTSGSTGQPKGVMVTHSNVDNFITWAIGYNRITRTDKMMLISSISFDISVFEIFGALLSGAELHLVSPNLLRDGYAFIDYLEDKGITIWHSVPSLMNQILAAIKRGQPANAKLERVRKVMLGGESWSTEMAREIADRFTEAEILNMYGPTEATIWISSYTIPRDTLGTMNKIPIGKPIDNNQILVLDPDMNLCSVGIPGEIYLCGANITNGYYKAKDQTRQTFQTREAGGLMYKSSDIGKYLPDGNIEYLGRKDGMVKIRGYRIEMGEIENALMKHQAVDAVSAIADERNNVSELLCFYVAQVQLTVNEIKAFLEESLPEYMMPSRFIPIESMPLLPNGKIEKKRLLELDISQRPAMNSKYESPSSNTEKYLVHLWSELLDMTEIGIHDNFFDLGGNSLILTTMQSILHERYRDHIKIIDLFKYPSVFKLAKHLDRNAVQQEEKADIVDVNMDDEIMKWLELGAAEDITTDDIVQGILNMEVTRGRDH